MLKYAVCTLLISSQLFAADLEKRAIFTELYGDTRTEASQPADAGAGAANELTAMTTHQLMEHIATLSDDEKFSTVSQYLAGKEMGVEPFANLIGALALLNMDAGKRDELVGLYAPKLAPNLGIKTLNQLLGLLSPGAFSATDAGANWAYQILDLYIEKKSLTFNDFADLMNDYASNGGSASLKDGKLLSKFVAKNAGKLEISQIRWIVRSVGEGLQRDQWKGSLLETFVLANSGSLVKPEFREAVASLRKDLPQGPGLLKAESLAEGAKTALFTVEQRYFGELFFGIGGVIKGIEQGASTTEWKSVSDLFVERNAHRLDEAKAQKLKAHFR